MRGIYLSHFFSFRFKNSFFQVSLDLRRNPFIFFFKRQGTIRFRRSKMDLKMTILTIFPPIFRSGVEKSFSGVLSSLRSV